MAESTISGIQPTAAVKWRVHLARRRPLRAALAVCIVAASAAAAYVLWGHPLAAVIVGFLVLSAVAEFLLPISYRIGADGVWCRNFLSVRHLPWSDIRRCYRDDRGIKLSPLGHRSRLEAYRGIYLWLDDNDAAVTDVIRAYRDGGMVS
jgi:hypothetical protein